MKIEVIETDRLYLRGFEKSDARFAVSIWNDPEMGEYLKDPSMEGVDEEYLKTIENLGEDDTCCYLISESKETHERIGTCSFIPSGDGRVYDIAYCVHRNYWRQGFATEMVEGMIGYAERQGAERVTVTVSRDNIASNAVMKKLGFEIAGEGSYKKRGTDMVFTDYKYERRLR